MNTRHYVSLEGLPGPTHHFGGLAYGNLHAMHHAQSMSSPQKAALESLSKMQRLCDLGVPVLVMPPHLRPNTQLLTQAGFAGPIHEQLQHAYDTAPGLFLAALSSSFMWTANAATVTPAWDSNDGHTHLTPANLSSQIHRAAEALDTYHFFQTFLASPHLIVHPPLPASFSDEGAANMIRLEDRKGTGKTLFAYGKSAFCSLSHPKHFPARQSKEACEAIARHHNLSPAHTWCIQQHPEAIDAGVFHQDVIAFGHHQVLVYHELAYVEADAAWQDFVHRWDGDKVMICEKDIPLQDIVKSYLCNGQLITTPDNQKLFFIPESCKDYPHILSWLKKHHPRFADEIHEIPVAESLKNGGGPACLRLTLPLTDKAWQHIYPGIKLTSEKITRLKAIVTDGYPAQFHPKDILNPTILKQCLSAQTQIRNTLGV